MPALGVKTELEALAVCLDERAGQYLALRGAEDVAEYLSKPADRSDEEILTEPILRSLIERVLGFPRDAYFEQLGRGGQADRLDSFLRLNPGREVRRYTSSNSSRSTSLRVRTSRRFRRRFRHGVPPKGFRAASGSNTSSASPLPVSKQRPMLTRGVSRKGSRQPSGARLNRTGSISATRSWSCRRWSKHSHRGGSTRTCWHVRPNRRPFFTVQLIRLATSTTSGSSAERIRQRPSSMR